MVKDKDSKIVSLADRIKAKESKNTIQRRCSFCGKFYSHYWSSASFVCKPDGNHSPIFDDEPPKGAA